MSYLIDTNSLIDADLKWYKPNIFPTIWNKLDSSKDIIIVPEVNKEILSPSNLVSWSKKNKSNVV
ncbi:hypothetical protein COSHB9_02180 [Companilactobacillus alimentarius]